MKTNTTTTTTIIGYGLFFMGSLVEQSNFKEDLEDKKNQSTRYSERGSWKVRPMYAGVNYRIYKWS